MKSWLPRLLVAVGLFVLLSAWRVSHYLPPLANPLTVDLVVKKGDLSESGPLVVTGRWAYGDFLYVKKLDDTHLQFGYDSWAKPGVSSGPVAFTPGVPLRLTIALPTLDQWHQSFAEPPGHLRVTANGTTVFDAPEIHYYKRDPHELWLAENPLGGTACGGRLRAQLLHPDGRELRGSLDEFISFRERLSGWLHHSRQVFGFALLGFIIAVGWLPLAWLRPSTVRAAWSRLAATVHTHRWFVWPTLVAAFVFSWMITRGTFDFIQSEELGAFYDFQMSSFLQGRLDVTEDAIGGEAFVFQGKLYGYFGPTPALMRLPFTLFDFAFGALSRTMMLVDFVGALIASYLLLRHALRLLGRDDLPSPFASFMLVANVGLGSTLFFLASRAYVYHEAILCGVAFALFSALFSLRYLGAPGVRREWLLALLFGLLSLHARPPTGLFALTLLGCVCVAHLITAFRARQFGHFVQPVIVGLLCVFGVLTFNGLSYLKFETFEGAPLRLSRPYTNYPDRLVKIEGKSFHAANLPYGAYTYFWRANIRTEPLFPWLYLGSNTPPHYFEKAKIDLPDHTNAVPWTMPGLFWVAVLGSLAALVSAPVFHRSLAVTWLAALPMTIALCAAIAAAQRYTGDFVPVIICAFVFGLALLDQLEAGWRRWTFRSVLAAATLFAVGFNFAMTLHYQRQLVWGVPENFRQDYMDFRSRLDRFFHSAP